ncbi:MAG: prolipoprotein diacylglyceryl transferase family protein [Pseudomonadota bacterium]
MHAGFVLLLALAFAVLYALLLPRLTGAGWQFLASVPLRRRENGEWQALNLTWYGIFLALGGTLAVALFLLATGSTGMPVTVAALSVTVILGACLPAARLITRIVEKNRHGFTVGGASFVGILLAPPLVLALQACGIEGHAGELHALPVLAAMAVAYVLGEGIGRLACVSFGCCRGCRIDALPPRLARTLAPLAVSWDGDTRHALWEPRALLDVVPIQAMTCVLYTVLALAGLYFFLEGQFRLAFAGTLIPALLWRVLSEYLRADWRGGRKFSVYQTMALTGSVWSAGWALALPAAPEVPQLAAGIATLWQAPVLVLLEAVFVVMFVYTGASTMTCGEIRFRARRRRKALLEPLRSHIANRP